MRTASLLGLLFLTLAPLSLVACAAQDEDTASDESEVKKKVQPTGGNGVFEFQKPSWWPADNSFSGYATFAGESVAVGASVQRVPGQHTFAVGRQTESIQLAAGQTIKRKATGLRVRFEKPITMGGVTFQSSLFNLDQRDLMEKPAEGKLVLVLPFSGWTGSSASSVQNENFTIKEGELEEIVLPTTNLVLETDEYDPAFPTADGGSTCDNDTTIRVGAGDQQETRHLRNQDGVAIGNQVVPHGDQATIRVRANGFDVEIPTANSTTKVTLNRLEVDDVLVQGTGTKVRGTYRIERKDPDGSWRASTCRYDLDTHTGVDLPNGTYRVTSSASTPTGTITDIQEVSFP